MAQIPDHIISDIRHRADIVEVVSGYIPLKKAGANYRALCPFHEEKTPSFNVNPAKQIFHCFGCGEGGNAFTFVMKYENISFPEAVRLLAGQYGVQIPFTGGDKLDNETGKLYQVVEAAADFFTRQLQETSASGPHDYMKKRNLTPDLVNLFRIGWAPDEWEMLTRSLAESGFTRKTIETAGLGKISSRGNLIDHFRNRLIFPIADVGGRIIGFAGRTIDDKQKGAPKYLNSPETPIYNKSRVLYGLHLAKTRARETNTLYVVEGYMDVISLHCADIKNCAAVAGVAFTTKQAETIRRICDNVVVVFDSDDAGVAAARKSLPTLLDAGLKARVLSLPGTKDPDEFISKHGREEFLRLAADASPFPQFIIDNVMKSADLESVEGRVKATKEVMPFLRRIRDEMERSEYIQILSDRAGVSAINIQREAKSTKLSTSKMSPPLKTTGSSNLSARAQAEKIFIRILLDSPSYLESVASGLSADDFTDQSYKNMFELILAAKERGITGSAGILNLDMDETLRKSLTGLSLQTGLFDEEDVEKVAKDCANRIRYRPDERRLRLKEQVIAVKEGKIKKFKEAQKKYIESRCNRI